MRTRYTPLFLCGALLLMTACGRSAVQRSTAVEGRGATVVRAAPEEPSPGEFRFPDDAAGKLLSKHLTPGPPRPLPEPAAAPHRAPVPRHLDSPELPLPPSTAAHAS